MNQTSIDRLVKEFSKLHYEPEHTETTCWCNPKFLNKDGVLHIEHNEQRVILKDWLRSALSQARQEGRREAAKYIEQNGTPEWDGDWNDDDKVLTGYSVSTEQLALTTEGK